MAGDRRGPATIVDVANSGRRLTATKATPGLARPKASTEVTADPLKLARYLSELEARLEDLARLTAANVFGSGVLLRNISMPKNTLILVDHRLGRTMQGWVATRIVGAAAVHPVLAEVPLPSTRSYSQWVQLESSGDCTVDILVF